jgi:hypothetical protein
MDHIELMIATLYTSKYEEMLHRCIACISKSFHINIDAMDDNRRQKI